MSLKDIKDKATKTVKDGVDIESIKKTAEEAKSNMTAENIKGLDNKKKAMIGGGAIVAVLALFSVFSGGGSVDRMALDTPFPSDATVAEQCSFIGDYHVSIFQAASNGDSSESILLEMNATNNKTSADVDRSTPEFYFYKELFSAKKKVPRLVDSIDSPDYKAMSSDVIAQRIAREGSKRVTKCLAAYEKK